MVVGGVAVGPGERRHLELAVARLPTHTELSLPMVVVRGVRRGPRLWLSAAIHGDELDGVEIIRRVLARLDPARLRGDVLAVPIVNVFGFLQQSRYLPDGRDLNRSFPGSPRGSLAARLAHLFMTEVVSRCSHGIDLHTATRHRTNLPHVRADLEHPETRRCAEAFGAPVTIHARTRDGSLREAASRRGIPVLLFEGGEAQRFDRRAIAAGARGVVGVMQELGMLGGRRRTTPTTLVATSTRWIRAPRSGVLRLRVRGGARVAAGDRLGVIANTLGGDAVDVRAPSAGTVIGHSLNPVVNQGDGIVHLAAGAAPPRRG